MTRKPWLVLLILVLLLSACDDFDEGNPAFENEGELIAAADEPLENFSDEPVETLPEEPLESFSDEPIGNFDSVDCPFVEPDGVDITCGYLMVPENRTRPDSRTIELAYAIVYAAEDEGRSPIVYLAGGQEAALLTISLATRRDGNIHLRARVT